VRLGGSLNAGALPVFILCFTLLVRPKYAIWPLLCTWHIRKTDGNSAGWSTMAYMFNLFGRYNRYGENIQ
jgi:hypothetical protein